MAEYTDKGTLKRDPNAPKTEAAATPEEKAARVAAARERALAARAAGGTVAARPAQPAAADVAAAATTEQPVAAAAPAAPADGQPRTAKGTIKRDPNAPKTEAPATPEERARRLAEAKAKAAAAKAAREAGGGTAAGLQPAAAAAAAANVAAPGPSGESDADRAERRRIFEIVTRGVPGAEPVLRPVVSARAERPPARAAFALSEPMEDIVRYFREGAPGVEIEVLTSPFDVVLVVDRGDLLTVLETGRNHPHLDMKFLRFITGVDLLDEGIEVVYGLKSLTTRRSAIIKTIAPARDPVIDSASSLWGAANWHERELMEMFGVVCRGHPDPRNLLLDEDMTIHPLLKAHPLAEVELKQGVNVF
ncbi:MAG: NADH-quinone oxidoreductase subunit C [Chloroflexi bacterium]|nr:NADH-quinone oxidoreductase subunit C [Chloroflexota bacterium]